MKNERRVGSLSETKTPRKEGDRFNTLLKTGEIGYSNSYITEVDDKKT